MIMWVAVSFYGKGEVINRVICLTASQPVVHVHFTKMGLQFLMPKLPLPCVLQKSQQPGNRLQLGRCIESSVTDMTGESGVKRPRMVNSLTSLKEDFH